MDIITHNNYKFYTRASQSKGENSMKTAYFVKVSKSMSWNDLTQAICEQKKNKAKPLPFTLATTVNITVTDFNAICQSLQKPNTHYVAYTPLSVATSKGIWKCILINCIGDSRNILIYTAGNIYPLYASILDTNKISTI